MQQSIRMADHTANRQLKRTNGGKLIKIYLVEFHTPFHTMSNYALDKFQIVAKSMYRTFCRRGLNSWKEIDVQVGQNPENTVQRWKSSCSRVRNFLSYQFAERCVLYKYVYC